jgi:hypothetical protein
VLARAGMRRGVPRARLALALAALLLLLAGVATATYLGVRTWVEGAGGVQLEAGYGIARTFAVPDTVSGGLWGAFASGPHGVLYGVAGSNNRPRVFEVGGKLVLDERSLGGAGFTPSRFAGPIAAAPNGDLFLAVRAERTTRAAGNFTLFVRHANGTLRRVVTQGDVVRADAYPRLMVDWPALAASSDSRVWLVVEPFERHGPQRLVEVAGGRIRSFRLPASPDGHLYWRDDWRWQLASEPGRHDSVLLAGSNLWTGAFRLYRVDESGQTRLLFERRRGAGATIASNAAGAVLPVVGLERYDRISLISIATGSVVDVGRSFRNVVSVAAGEGGKIYAFAYDLVGGRLTVYTLVRGAAAGQPARELAPGAFAFPRVSDPPALWIEHQSDSYRTTVVTVRTDGTGFRRLVEKASVLPFCRSVDGREVAFASDRAVPTEPWTYLARSGTAPVKISERADWPLCPFDSRRLVTWRATGARPGDLELRDLRTGRVTLLARHVELASWSLALSPDGLKLAYARNGVLTTVELATLARRTVAKNAFEPVWSPDSRRLAYLVGGRTLRVSGSSFHVRFVNETPSFSWSPDGTRLLVCLARRLREPGCRQGDGSAGSLTAPPHERLLLVDVRTGAVRQVAAGAIVYAGWSPTGAYAYVTRRTLRIVASDGRTRSFSARILGGDGSWLGFSPDGRWFGFLAGTGEKWPRGIAVLDTRTGRSRVLRPLGPGWYSAGWWP